MWSRRFALLVVGAIALSTSGCDPLPDSESGDISLRNLDGELLLRSCQTIEFNSMTLSWMSSESGSELVAWQADGHVRLREGVTLHSTAAPAGAVESVWNAVDLSEASHVFFQTAWAGSGVMASIEVPEDFSESSGWLNSNGSVSAQPCEG